MLAAERDAGFFFVELENFDFDLVIYFDDFGRMLDAAPGEIGDVQETIKTAEIDEDAVISDVLDAAGDCRAFDERIHQSVALGLGGFFEQRAAADDYVAALAIEFENAQLDLAIFPGFEIVDGAQLDLRGGEKRADADIYDETAFDALENFAGDGFVLAIGFVDAFPDAAAMRAGVREEDVAVLVFVKALDFDGLACAKGIGGAGVEEFLRGDQAFEFSADVHDDACIGDCYYAAVEDFAFGRGGLGRGVLLDELFHALGGFGFG